MIVYIAGPYRAKTTYLIEQNINKAKALALEVWKKGHIAVCPHANTAHFDGELPDFVWLNGAIEIMKRCDAVVLVEGWENSAGTIKEIEATKEVNISIYKSIDELPSPK